MASVKLSDIAQKLNTSTVTVSNALNGKGAISAELRRKILQTAQEMGYQRRTKPKEGSLSTVRRDPLAPLLQTITPTQASRAPSAADTEQVGTAQAAQAGSMTTETQPTNATPTGSTQAGAHASSAEAVQDSSTAATSARAPSAGTPTYARLNQQIGVVIAQRYISVGASFYWNLYQLTATTAASYGLSSTILQVSDEQVAQEQLPHLLTLLQPSSQQTKKALQLDGLIIMGPFPHHYLELLAQLPIPCTLLDYYDEALELTAVLSHNYINSYQITRHVIKKGHQCLGFIGNQIGFDNIADRFYGFERALMLSELELNPAWVFDDRDPISGKLYDSTPLPPDFIPGPPEHRVPTKMPTAFVCNCDASAAILAHTLEQRGFKVPDDISLVGYDNYLNDARLAHELTTLDGNLKLMAQFAVSNLLQLLQGKHPTTQVRRLEGHIIERSSVRTMLD